MPGDGKKSFPDIAGEAENITNVTLADLRTYIVQNGISNIISSIILGKWMGIAGIFLGTLLSLGLMYFWKLYLFSRKYGINIRRKAACLAIAAALLFLCGKVGFHTGHDLVNAVLQSAVAGSICIAGSILPFVKADEFQYMKQLAGKFLGKRRGKA